MSTQMMFCLGIFIYMLVIFLLGKWPLGVTSGTVMTLLVITGCLKPAAVLANFGNDNTIVIGAMIVVAAGLGRTSLPKTMTTHIRTLTRGNYKLAYMGVLFIGFLLTSMLTSPMAAYAISFPIMDSVCDEYGVSRSKGQFPLVLICVACCAILPFGFALSEAAVFNGFMQTYGFTTGFTAMDFFKGRWPMIFVVFAWAYFIAPKVTLDKPIVPIAALESEKKAKAALTPFADKAGIIIFCLVILGFVFSKQIGLPTWLVSFTGVLFMMIFKVLTKQEAIAAIPVDICLLFIGANSMATALVKTGTADYIGKIISANVGSSASTLLLHTVFFAVPFAITQFMQNQSVMNVFAPIALLTCSALGADPRGCLILIAAGSLTAFMTPSATAAIAISMSAGGYDVKALFKMGWLVALLLTIAYIAYVSMVYPAF